MDRLTDEQIDSLEKSFLTWVPQILRQSVIQAFSDLRHYKQENASLLQVVEERGKALEFYENKENYDIREVEVSEHVTEYVSNVSEDYGDCARKALGKE